MSMLEMLEICKMLENLFVFFVLPLREMWEMLSDSSVINFGGLGDVGDPLRRRTSTRVTLTLPFCLTAMPA